MNSVRQDYKRDVRGTVLDDRNEVLSNADVSWLSDGIAAKLCKHSKQTFKPHWTTVVLPLFAVLR